MAPMASFTSAGPSDMATAATPVSEESLLFLYKKKTRTVRILINIPTCSPSRGEAGVPSARKSSSHIKRKNKIQSTSETGRQSKTHITLETTERPGGLSRRAHAQLLHPPAAKESARHPSQSLGTRSFHFPTSLPKRRPKNKIWANIFVFARCQTLFLVPVRQDTCNPRTPDKSLPPWHAVHGRAVGSANSHVPTGPKTKNTISTTKNAIHKIISAEVLFGCQGLTSMTSPTLVFYAEGATFSLMLPFFFSSDHRSTSPLAPAEVHHNHAHLPPANERLQHIARQHTLRCSFDRGPSTTIQIRLIYFHNELFAEGHLRFSFLGAMRLHLLHINLGAFTTHLVNVFPK